ncbi:MAG: 2-phospho-L-lactate guanylyltransferase [Georgfuchsia sp.]
MWAIVPLKSPEFAKSRLSDVLNPLARRDLFFAVARHVITTLLHTPGITRVAVVTASDAADTFARDCGATVIRQDGDRGTAAAFSAAIEALRPQHLERMLMIAGDLPLLTTAAVAQLIAAGTDYPSVVIAPDRQRTGTNALLCSPPEIIPPCFGIDSFRRHREAAIACGAALEIVESPYLALDVDVADDLDYLQRRLGDSLAATDAATAASLHDALAARRPQLKIVGEKP